MIVAMVVGGIFVCGFFALEAVASSALDYGR